MPTTKELNTVVNTHTSPSSPRVLMLGWEFPPVINGGLGVACHDLCIALSKMANVTMIIPKSNPDFVVKNLNLIGLNTIDAKTLRNIGYTESYKKVKQVHYINTNLNPYYNSNNSPSLDLHSQYLKKVQIGNETAEVFHIEDLYGGDVIEKVTVFGKLAAKLALSLDFDIIHAHDWMTMIAGMEIKAATGKPLAVHIHSLEVDRGGPNSKGWVYQMEKRGMETADVLMPVSNFTGHVIHDHYQIPWSKIHTIHNGIRPVVPFRSEKLFKEKMVLFVGRLTRQKGPEYFVEIAEKVLQTDQNVRFVMAGTGEYFNPLLERAAQRGIAHRFHLTGFLNLDKVRTLLSMADVYVMPSVSEPFGLSAVEAVQFGIPAVISKQSGVAEVLKGSLKFDYWDVDRAAGYILRLLHDDVLMDKVKEDAYKDLENISWDHAAAKVIEGYRKFSLIPEEEIV
ncbi:glycosyltransferase family 4 protein [soil metagenome]